MAKQVGQMESRSVKKTRKIDQTYSGVPIRNLEHPIAAYMAHSSNCLVHHPEVGVLHVLLLWVVVLRRKHRYCNNNYCSPRARISCPSARLKRTWLQLYSRSKCKYRRPCITTCGNRQQRTTCPTVVEKIRTTMTISLTLRSRLGKTVD